MSGIPDRDLSRAVRSGDEDAFARLFDRYAHPVYAYCFRRSADSAVAEDLTSIVFMEAWRRRDTADLSDENVRSWLFGIATNVVRNQQRSRRRYRAVLRRLQPLEPERDFADDLAERLDAERRMRALLARIRRLPRREQEVVFLWASGLTSSEAGDALGIAEATVRTRLFRARARLGIAEPADLDVAVRSPKEAVP